MSGSYPVSGSSLYGDLISSTQTSAPNRAYPYLAVVYITVDTSDGKEIQGSGVLISPNEVLTAAHVLPTTAQYVYVDPGRAGNDRPFGYYQASSWVTDENLTGKTTLTPTQSQTDFGVITLPVDLGYETGWFGVTSDLSGQYANALNVTGYPDTDKGVEQTIFTPVMPDGEADDFDYGSGATAPGSSGGPLWLAEASQAAVAGVVSTGAYGPRIDDTTYPWIEQQISAHPVAAEAAVTNSDFANNTYPVSFDLLHQVAEAGTGGPTAIDRTPTGTGLGDTIFATTGDGDWTIGDSGSAEITWDSTVGYAATTHGVDGHGGITVTANSTSIDATGVSSMHFIDGTLSFDPSSTAAQVYRLYLAVVGRVPDALGQENYVDQIDNNGYSLEDVANAFLSGGEYTAKYGASISNAQFLTQLYQNALGRVPDSTGFNSYLNDLANGSTRAQVVVAFVEGAEMQADTAPALAAGLWTADPMAAEVARLYYTAFGRAPDQAGLTSNLNGLYGDATLLDVANAALNSGEYLSDFGTLTNQQFIDTLYNVGLGRAPDPVGEQAWLGQVNGGVSRAEVLLAFSQGAEQENRLASVIDQSGIKFI